MFKNRVRTAALAGAVALATGLSGFSAPAFAVDTTQQDQYNVADGSAAQNVTPENISEKDLKDLTDATAEYLAVFQTNPRFKAIVEEYIELGQDGFGPSEEAAQKAFADARAEAKAQLNTTSENIQKARASVAYALEVDAIATADWKAFVASLNAFRAEINPLIAAANDENKTEKQGDELPLIPLIEEADTNNAAAVYLSIFGSVHTGAKGLIDEVNKQYEVAGYFFIDRNRQDYVTRDHMAALEALKAGVDAESGAVKAAFDKAVASNREAQASDVLVRQTLLERATAQRDVLRAVEAYFSVAARYIELFQNDELVNGGQDVLSTLYRSVLSNIVNGIKYNVADLNKADRELERGYESWRKDQATNDESVAYQKEKLDFATKIYKKIFANGKIWQEELKRVELIDQGIIDARQAEADRLEAEAERVAKEEAEREAIRKALEALAGTGETPAPAPKGSSFKLSS